jgi:hypothetical protein
MYIDNIFFSSTAEAEGLKKAMTLFAHAAASFQYLVDTHVRAATVPDSAT